MSQRIRIENAGDSRTTNPTPLPNGGSSKFAFDDLGRQLVRPYQVRDLITTARVSVSNGTKTALVTASSGEYLDLVQLTCSNDSTVATSVVISDESTTIRTIQIPATSSVNLFFQVPIAQNAAGTAWYVDLPDITGTNVEVAAEFSREV